MRATRHHATASRRRRLLAATWALLTILTPLAFWRVDTWGLGAFALVAIWLVVYWLLRRAVASRADMPDHQLDEREIAQRDRVYLHAYQGFASAIAVLLFAMSLAADRAALGYDDLSAAMWFALGLGLGLPSAILAWRMPAEID